MRSYLLIVLFLSSLTPTFAQIEELHPCRDLSEFLCSYPPQNKVTKYLQEYARLNANDPFERILFSENELRNTYKITDNDLQALFEESKTLVREGITELKDVNGAEKIRLAKQLENSHFMTFGKFLRIVVPDLDRKKIQNKIREIAHCGPEGLYSNAFQYSNFTVFCPGIIIEHLNHGAEDKSEILLGLSHTMGHELGHLLDRPNSTGRYKATGKCFDQYEVTPDFWKTFGNEVFADYWGSVVFAKMIQKKKPERDNLIRTMARHMSFECNMPASKIHPPGKLRIDLMLKTNPIIQEALGCRKKFLRSCPLQEF